MKRKFSIYFFLFFFIFSEKLYAETISTAQTADSTKTTTEDITVTATGSYTCSTVSNCIKFNGDNLTLDNSGTITHDTADKDNVIRFATSGSNDGENFTIINSGTIHNETGNNAIYFSGTDGGYIKNTGTIKVTAKKGTIKSQDNTNFIIDNYGTITNLSTNGQAIESLGDDTGTINNYAGGIISAPNNTQSAEKGAFNTKTNDESDGWTINNWGTVSANYDTMTIGNGYTVNNYGTIKTTNYDTPAIIPVGDNNTINLYDGSLLIGYIDDGTDFGEGDLGEDGWTD